MVASDPTIALQSNDVIGNPSDQGSGYMFLKNTPLSL
jgi:hypothetical protein